MKTIKTSLTNPQDKYDSILTELTELLEKSRRLTARSVNAVMTATYWEIGRRIVEVEQKGAERAEYGENLLKRLSKDLMDRFGRGFSRQNLQQMHLFYLGWQKSQTVSGKSTKILPDENVLIAEIEKSRKIISGHPKSRIQNPKSKHVRHHRN